MRTCKIVLRCARKLYKLQIDRPTIGELVRQTRLPTEDVFDACKILTDQWYMKFLYADGDRTTSSCPGGVTLTIKGRHPIEYTRNQCTEYLKAHWISLLALLVSIAALTVSVLSALYPGVVKVILIG